MHVSIVQYSGSLYIVSVCHLFHLSSQNSLPNSRNNVELCWDDELYCDVPFYISSMNSPICRTRIYCPACSSRVLSVTKHISISTTIHTYPLQTEQPWHRRMAKPTRTHRCMIGMAICVWYLAGELRSERVRIASLFATVSLSSSATLLAYAASISCRTFSPSWRSFEICWLPRAILRAGRCFRKPRSNLRLPHPVLLYRRKSKRPSKA